MLIFKGGDYIFFDYYFFMILCISWFYIEDGGGSYIVRVLVIVEVDYMGFDILSDVFIYIV